MSGETKDKKKHSRQPNPRLPETVTVLDKTIPLNSTMPGTFSNSSPSPDPVFSVRNVELISPNSPSPSFDHHRHQSTAVLEDAIGTNPYTHSINTNTSAPAVGTNCTNSSPSTNISTVGNETLINPNSQSSFHHQQPKQKRNRCPKPRMIQNTCRSNTLANKPSSTTISASNYIAFSMAGMNPVDSKSSTSSSYHLLSQSPRETSRSEPTDLMSDVLPLSFTSLLMDGENELLGLHPPTPFSTNSSSLGHGWNPVTSNFAQPPTTMSTSSIHSSLKIPVYKPGNLTPSVSRVAHNSAFVDLESGVAGVVPTNNLLASMANTSSFCLSALPTGIQPKNLSLGVSPIFANNSVLTNSESVMTSVVPTATICRDNILAGANPGLIYPNFLQSFSHHQQWLPPLPLRASNQELINHSFVSSPVLDTSMVNDVVNRGPRVMSTTSSSNNFVSSLGNLELNNSKSFQSSYWPNHGLPNVLCLNPESSEPENLRSAVQPTIDNSVLINEGSRVSKVMPPMDAVVKVFCVRSEPNLSLPWQRKRQSSSTSSGFVIDNRRILTSAHSVEHYAHVKLRKGDSHTKYVATVLSVGIECDIALLTVEDDEFWEGVSPVEFGDLPALQDAVTVVGYPIGGDTISVTSGVVSRIEILSYVHGSTELLGLQIDAAINSGNSGGPAFNDKGNCVGIAFQSLKHEDVENIGYVIPTPVIMHFIQDYEKNGAYTGFPILGVEWQKMENPDLRLSMGMKPDHKGVRIRRIDPTAPEFQVLKPSDVILSFDGVDIAYDGTVPFRHGERMGFSYLVSQKYTGDSATMKVLRNSETLEFSVKLDTHRRLVPAHNKGRPPSYYIIAGFVFTTVSVPYLRSEYGKDYEFEAPVKLLDKLLHEMPQSPDEQIVVVSQVLVADINIGYEDIVNTQVHAFNGQPVRNLKSLASMVEACNDEYLKFDLEYQQIVVLQTKKAKAATLDILSTHCIPSAMSDDLKT